MNMDVYSHMVRIRGWSNRKSNARYLLPRLSTWLVWRYSGSRMTGIACTPGSSSQCNAVQPRAICPATSLLGCWPNISSKLGRLLYKTSRCHRQACRSALSLFTSSSCKWTSPWFFRGLADKILFIITRDPELHRYNGRACEKSHCCICIA